MLEGHIAKMAGWKAPGPDGIHAARLRKWVMVTDSIREWMWKFMDNGEEFRMADQGKDLYDPKWRVHRRTSPVPAHHLPQYYI